MKSITNLNQLKKKLDLLKKKGKKIVHCHGVFDVLHVGHINHFLSAKKKGDILVVTVTPDEFINKGPNRPIHNLNNRIKCIASLGVVNFVAANNSASAVSAINVIKPNIYCKGKDYKNNKLDLSKNIIKEKNAVKMVGGKIIYTNDDLLSSSKIINNLGLNLNESQKKFLDQVKIEKKNKNSDPKNKIFDKFKNLKVLVIGETIVDDYNFCSVSFCRFVAWSFLAFCNIWRYAWFCFNFQSINEKI